MQGSFVMDVYEITDGASFSDSVMHISNATWYATNSNATTNAENSIVTSDTATDYMEEDSYGSGDMDGTSLGYKPTHNLIVLLSTLLTAMLSAVIM